MAPLILEYSRKKEKVQNPEARFCYVFKNLIELRLPKFTSSIFYKNEKGDILAELFLPDNEIYINIELWDIFADNYDKNKIPSEILSVLKFQSGRRYMKSNAWKIPLAIKYLLEKHFNIKIAKVSSCINFSENYIKGITKKDLNWEAKCPGAVHAMFEL